MRKLHGHPDVHPSPGAASRVNLDVAQHQVLGHVNLHLLSTPYATVNKPRTIVCTAVTVVVVTGESSVNATRESTK